MLNKSLIIILPYPQWGPRMIQNIQERNFYSYMISSRELKKKILSNLFINLQDHDTKTWQMRLRKKCWNIILFKNKDTKTLNQLQRTGSSTELKKYDHMPSCCCLVAKSCLPLLGPCGLLIPGMQSGFNIV